MTIKERTYKERETDDKKGKKSFQERLIQDKEAEQAIDEYLKGHDDSQVNLDYPER